MRLRWINSVAMIIGSNLRYVAKRNTASECKEHAIRASLFQSELSCPGWPSGHDQNEASDENRDAYGNQSLGFLHVLVKRRPAYLTA